MSQEDYNQARHADDVVTGEVVRDDEELPQTYLHKVASGRQEDDTAPWRPAEQEQAEQEQTAPYPVTPASAEHASVEDEPAEPETEAYTETEVYPEAEALSETGAEAGSEAEARTETGAEAGEPAQELAAEPESSAVPQARRPGDEALPPGTDGSLLADGVAIRERWMGVQARFVDDPRTAVTDAADIITDVTTRLEAAVRERQQVLRDRWDGNGQADTEMLRVLMQQYRALLDKLAAM